jgi:chloramphenicol-sensitive protein RarD
VEGVSALRRGYLYGFAAYALWGFFPLYFKLLRPASPAEVLAHRIVWALVAITVLVAVTRRGRSLAELARRPGKLAGAALAAVLVGLNWFTYIYGVDTNQVVETSLGYFIGPLVSVALGVLVLAERLRPAQWVAIGVGALAVAVLTVDYGRLPWIAMTLAVSFGLYGLVKKRLGLPAAEGLLVETAVLAPAALGYLIWLTVRQDLVFGTVSAAHTALLVISGPVTAIPLLLFAGAANRVPLSVLGLLQYLAPVLQLACGVLIFHEPMPPARLAGFALVWLALTVFTWDGIRSARKAARDRARRADPATPDPAALAA